MAASPRTSKVRHVPIPIAGTNKPDLPSGRISKVRFLHAMKNINGNEALPIKDYKELQYHTCEESRQKHPALALAQPLFSLDCGDGGMSSNCPNWSDRHFFLRVLMGTSYDLRARHSKSFFRIESGPEMRFGSSLWLS